MAVFIYKTETNPSCIFSSMGTVEETKKTLAFIMEGIKYEIIEEDSNV